MPKGTTLRAPMTCIVAVVVVVVVVVINERVLLRCFDGPIGERGEQSPVPSWTVTPA